MTRQERIKQAKREIDKLWKATCYWGEREGDDSELAKYWGARWLSASDMLYILTDIRYFGCEE